MPAQPIVVGGTYQWYATISKNTAAAPTTFTAWNLTGATITVTFIPPNAGTAKHYSASIVVAADGTVSYTNVVGTFDVAGTWLISWKVSQSGVILESRQSSFQVYPSAAAA